MASPATIAVTSRHEIDEITLRRAQKGDPAACRALVEQYQHVVFALLGRTVGRAHAASVEDIAQETFLSVFRNLASFSALGPARLSTWVLTIASRRAIDFLRARVTSEPQPDDAPAPRATHPMLRRELGDAIERAMAALAPEYRVTFLLREVHGFAYEDIAHSLSIDLGTVKSRLARARAALREHLAEMHHG
jgi:RNA polymerase sigma-70 factor (ECF subfamily)